LATLGAHTWVVLGVQWVPACARKHGSLRVRRQQDLVKRPSDDPGRVGVTERAERNRQCVALASTPAGAPLEELGACRADDEQRHAADAFGQRVDEVEQLVIGPLQVFEDEYERSPLGKCLNEAAPGGKAVRPFAGLCRQTGERGKLTFEPGALRRILQEPL